MKIKYFQETDTLYIEFKANDIVETQELDDHTLFEVDSHGQLCALTLEHAKVRANLQNFSFEQMAA
jgi:uncharacterized protein YuzE